MLKDGANFKYITIAEARKFYPDKKFDKLGRRRHPNQNGKKLYQTTSVRVDKETMKELRTRAKKQKVTMGQKFREYIEWGLENEK